MNGIGLAAWLTLAAALLAWGWLAAMVRRDRGGVLAGTVLLLAGATVTVAALVRHAVLPGAAVPVAVLALIAGAVLLLLGEIIAAGREEP